MAETATDIGGHNAGVGNLVNNGGFFPEGLLAPLVVTQGVIFAYASIEPGFAQMKSDGELVAFVGRSAGLRGAPRRGGTYARNHRSEAQGVSPKGEVSEGRVRGSVGIRRRTVGVG